MHALALRHHAVNLVRSGVANAEVGRRLSVPAGTVNYWVHMDRAKRGECPGPRKGCHNVKVYFKHLDCLFPQHGPGTKHDRPILLDPWQREIAAQHPWALIRGLIHSDGCRITNWTEKMVGGERKRYEYPRYPFANKSDDIRRIYSDTLTQVGVEWTTLARGSDPFVVSVVRRASVALMDLHVGPKY